MIKKRFAIVTGLVLAISLATNGISELVGSRSSASVDLGFVAPQICPEPVGIGQLTVAGSKALAVSSGKRPKTLTKVSGGERSVRVSAGAYITGDNHGAALAVLTPKVAVAPCRAAGIDTWFVGGSGALESQSTLTLINQAAGPATAEVTAWTSAGIAAPTTLTVPALSTARIALDRYASPSVVIRVKALSGRLGAYLLDTRARGLTKLGSDYVPSQSVPEKKIHILGLIGNSASKVRLLVPGTQDAVIRANVSFGSERYTPAGLDDLRVKAGSVVEVSIPTKNSKGFGAVTFDSDVPIVAGVYTPLVERGKQKDLIWLAPSTPLTSEAFVSYISGATNNLLLFTEAASVSVAATDALGRGKLSFSASPISLTLVKRSIKLEPNSGLFAAQLVRTNSGMSIYPISGVERTQKRLEPVTDIGVLAPRG